MNAEPLLNRIASVLAEHRLEAVMIGNAAAALHGAPVTTLDIDFMIRKTPLNLKKLKGVARSLDAVIFKTYYPASEMFRVVNDEQDIQLDFKSRVRGVISFEALRSRATSIEFGGHSLKVASVEDKVGERPRAVATSSFSKSSKRGSMNKKNSQSKLAPKNALEREGERALVDQIRRLLALPMNNRTHFLRVRRPGGGSHL
jgi:predicted nucleotidyltransferase